MHLLMLYMLSFFIFDEKYKEQIGTAIAIQLPIFFGMKVSISICEEWF